MAKKIYRIVFLGPQGSGKGTQAELVAAKLKLPIISTGDIYRREAARANAMSEKIASYMNQGQLVPDDITNALIAKRLAQADCKKGFILDGYPRTISQAEALEEMTELTQVVLIDISDKVAVSRIAGRLMCVCGATYNLKTNPPKVSGVCDKCGAKIFVRKDDKEEAALRQRLAIYHRQIDPLIAFYQKKKILKKINGEQSIAKVGQDVLAFLVSE